MDQYRLTSRVQQLLDEWEIQFLVLVSFALQAFLLFFSGIRKRTISGVLSALLWLAYVSADSLAIFVLGHLTLHINGLRHKLVLFWAPFMLLHLGGQETITAFSMEDNMLWKRHLLSLATQVALAIYIVSKQWQGGKQLLAPLVLMFISGTVRYAERTWALMTAAKSATPGSSFDISDVHKVNTYAYLFQIHKSLEKEPAYAKFVWLAGLGLKRWMAFLMEMMPSLQRGRKIIFSEEFLRNKNRVHSCYKLVQVQLSLIYDYYYTKLGTRHCHLSPVVSWIPRLITLGSTSAALTLFVRADIKGFLVNSSRADIAVSYTLLIGAITLELISNIIAISSYWAYLTAMENFPRGRAILSIVKCAHPEAIFSIVKCAHPESRCQWSEKLAQYNIIDGCILEKQASLLGWIMQWVGINRDTTHVKVSSELKEVLLDKLLHIANSPHVDDWDFTKFSGQWAKWELQNNCQGRTAQALFSKTIECVDFLSSILIWHIATDICFFDDEVCNSPFRGPSRMLSNYIMCLASKHGILIGNDGHFVLEMARREVAKFLEVEIGGDQQALEQCKVVKSIRDKVGKEDDLAEEHIREFRHIEVFSDVPILPRAHKLATGLLKFKEPIDPWKLIINVWMEMLCYMAPHCGAGFHFKHLSTGGEFVTHVRILLLNLGLTAFWPQTKEPSQPLKVPSSANASSELEPSQPLKVPSSANASSELEPSQPLKVPSSANESSEL